MVIKERTKHFDTQEEPRTNVKPFLIALISISAHAFKIAYKLPNQPHQKLLVIVLDFCLLKSVARTQPNQAL